MVAAPSQSPVKVLREAKVAAVGVGGGIVGDAGGAVGEAQADRTQSRRVEKIRMSVNIIQRIQKIPIRLGGNVKDTS
jgi:hypothetical protein